MADRALAGRVIASHYADAVDLALVEPTDLKAAADESSESLAALKPGALFRLLESKLGWAWGYGGADARVGYVRAAALNID